MPCHSDKEKESSFRVTYATVASWGTASAYKDSMYWYRTGQAPKGFTHDLLPTFPFVKRTRGTQALHISPSAHPTHSGLMVGKANPANQKVPLLEGNPRVRGTKKNLAKPSKTADNEGYIS